METAKSDYYYAPKAYPGVVDPFSHGLYMIDMDDLEVTKELQELIDYAVFIDEKVETEEDLDWVVSEFRANAFSFVRSGLMAHKVKYLKIYKKQYKSFENFCKNAIGVTHWQVNRWIDGARVTLELIAHHHTVLPKNEAQCRELSSFYGEYLDDTWSKVINSMPEHQISAKTIKQVIAEQQEPKEIDDPSVKVEMSVDAYCAMREEAREQGYSCREYLDQLFLPNAKFVPNGREKRTMEVLAKLVEDNGGYAACFKKLDEIEAKMR